MNLVWICAVEGSLVVLREVDVRAKTALLKLQMYDFGG